jgi:hypothetical protein
VIEQQIHGMEAELRQLKAELRQSRAALHQAQAAAARAAASESRGLWSRGCVRLTQPVRAWRILPYRSRSPQPLVRFDHGRGDALAAFLDALTASLPRGRLIA